ncbi:MAG: hypothetical protein NZL96_03080 [Patescibacteria group bacterium]|nr:hypothetical protein [Patescibacteria group bacterium]
MIKKLVIYLLFFSLLSSLNLFLCFRIFRFLERKSVIERIIADIDMKKNYFQSLYQPSNQDGYRLETELGDSRVANLKSFFRKYQSPLYDYAEKIIEASDKYGLDYRLLPAIAMQESNLCKYIPENSYNCWGWGIYGTQVIRFKSYEEAIETVARGIKRDYIDKGLITATAIMKKYTPRSRGSWAYGVNSFMRMLE